METTKTREPTKTPPPTPKREEPPYKKGNRVKKISDANYENLPGPVGSAFCGFRVGDPATEWHPAIGDKGTIMQQAPGGIIVLFDTSPIGTNGNRTHSYFGWVTATTSLEPIDDASRKT